MHHALLMSPLLFRLRRKKIVFFSVFTCPHCGKRSRDQMQSNACVYFYPCLGCGRMVTPLPGKCCVYCSYGTEKCPPKQMEEMEHGAR